MSLISTHDIAARLPGWRMDSEGVSIQRELVFADFSEAFGFMTCVAIYAEKHDHHPEWSNVYNKLSIRLTTHDAGGLTQRDLDFARYADELFATRDAVQLGQQ